MFSMSFDGLFTYGMTQELANELSGGRIVKIHQPFINEIILTIRANGKNHKLLLSAHPTYARVQLTKESYENPQEPPMFCMLLRKHMEGFFIEEISQKQLDRILIFKIRGRNEIGDLSYKKLIIEIMGRHSNIILVDEEKGQIIDSVKHISYAVNRHRAILPGQSYVWPPEQDKQNPLTFSEELVAEKLDFNSGDFEAQLVRQFAGISPLLAKEIIHQAGIANRLTVPKAFVKIMDKISSKKFKPSLIRGDKKENFYLFPLDSIKGELTTYHSLSELLDHFYFGKAERDRVKQIGGDLEKFIRNEIEKLTKKMEKLKETLSDAENSTIYQRFGELITANLYAVKKGMEQIEVMDYYDENNSTVTIELDKRKSPSENAQWYFGKYQKGKNAIEVVKEQISKAKEELYYFEGLLQQIETAAPKDIEEMKEELQEEGYFKIKQKKQKKQQKHVPNIEKYMATDGTTILIGKNNKQNDYLTTQLGKRDEIWLHTKDIPGSHVVIRNTDPSNETILEAAQLAAYFSKARSSSSVPVDFTKIRHVKKPRGAKPGFVIYDNQQTVYVTPDVEMVSRLKENGL